MNKLFFMLTGAVLFAATALSGESPGSPGSFSVVKAGAGFKVVYRGSPAAHVTVAIYDHFCNLVFSETLRNVESFIRPYNFSGLSGGIYTIRVSNGKSAREECVSWCQERISRAIRVHRLRGGHNRFMLGVPVKGEEHLTIRIFDERNNLLHEEEEHVSSGFARVYRLRRVNGEVRFEVSGSDGTGTAVAR